MRRYCKFTKRALYCTLWITCCGNDYEPVVRQTKLWWWWWCSWWWWWCAYTDQFKSGFRHTGKWSAAAWQPHRLCHRPSVFFRHFRFLPLSFQQGKNSAPISKLLLFLFLLLWNVVHLRLLRPNLKLRKIWERLYIWTFRTNTILTGQEWKMLLLFPRFVTLLNLQPVDRRRPNDTVERVGCSQQANLTLRWLMSYIYIWSNHSWCF